MAHDDDPRVYEALALPNEALGDGGIEILRAGIINDALHIAARRALEDQAQWGEILADIAKHIAGLYAAEVPGLTEQDVTVQIAQAFAAALGAKPIADAAPRASAKAKATPRRRKPARPRAKTPRRKR